MLLNLKTSDQIAVDGENTVWQTKVQIPILQVEAQTAQKLNAYVRFYKNAKGEIFHMEKPEKPVPVAWEPNVLKNITYTAYWNGTLVTLM